MIDPEALALICAFEGCHERRGRADLYGPYRCPAGVATIGYGSIWQASGRHVTLDDPPITQAAAMQLMQRELERDSIPAVARLIHVKLHPLMHGALVSFTYNMGAGALRGSTLRRVVNARRWMDVPDELLKWRVAGGRVLPGLERRRRAEAAMFLRGVRQLSTDLAWTPIITSA